MKKCLLMVVSVLLISSFAYAADFSIGITGLGWGPTFVRGTSDTAKFLKDGKEGDTKIPSFKRDISYNMGFSPAIAVLGQVDNTLLWYRAWCWLWYQILRL